MLQIPRNRNGSYRLVFELVYYSLYTGKYTYEYVGRIVKFSVFQFCELQKNNNIMEAELERLSFSISSSSSYLLKFPTFHLFARQSGISFEGTDGEKGCSRVRDLTLM